ncbi:hypothetical protein ACQKWADRAFT_202678 [Trichoderma austrokoningii]
MIHISCLILRYLCGQASKASQDLCFVGFIHNTCTFPNHEPEGGSEHITMNLNSLKTSLNLWQAYGTTNNNSISVTADNESLWELIHQHQEWIYSKITTFNQWELLSAAQATTLYLLLRVKQGRNSTAFPNGDIALLFTLGVSCLANGSQFLSMIFHKAFKWKANQKIRLFLGISIIPLYWTAALVRTGGNGCFSNPSCALPAYTSL